MIPDIGLMVGAYIITRMVKMITIPGRVQNVTVMIFGIITIILTTISVVDLVTRGVSAAPGLGQ